MAHGIKSLTFDDAERLRAEWAGRKETRIKQRVMAKREGIGVLTLQRILHGKTYRTRDAKGGRVPKPDRIRRHSLYDNGGSIHRLRTARTFSLLRRIGVPRSELGYGNRNFWSQNSMVAEHLAKLVKSAYRSRMQSLHPDRNGDSREAALLNQIVAVLRKRFKRRGIKL